MGTVSGPGNKSPRQFIKTYCMAVASAFCAETVTYPLDVTKTRMQIAGETINPNKTALNPQKPYGMTKMAICIVQNEGLIGLWRGISPALCRHVIYAGVNLSLYEKMRDDVFGKEPDGSFPLHKSAITGFLVGGMAQFCSNPMVLVKVQLQMEGRRRLEGKAPRVTGVYNALSKIWKEAGVRGLWRGWVPNAQRGALVNMGILTTYDCAKRLIIHKTNMKDGTGVHVVSSFLAGLSATIMAAPSDVVATRLMNQPTKDGRGLYYKNAVDCLRKTVRNEGVLALYKGFLPLWMRLGPASLTFWVVFEQLRKTVGLSSF